MNTASRSKMSTSGSVTSPWINSGMPRVAMRPSTGMTRSTEVTPCAEWDVPVVGTADHQGVGAFRHVAASQNSHIRIERGAAACYRPPAIGGEHDDRVHRRLGAYEVRQA